MGGIVSVQDGHGRSLQPAILNALAKKKKEDAAVVPPITFETLQSKFNLIHIGLVEIKRSFHRFSKHETLDKQGLELSVKTIYEDITSEQIRDIFAISDVNESRNIDFSEFVTALIVSLVIHDFPPDSAPSSSLVRYNNLREMFGLIISCYILIDLECKSYINKKDVDRFIKSVHHIHTDNLSHEFSKKLVSDKHWGDVVSNNYINNNDFIKSNHYTFCFIE